jgi:uncharacterized membrane protein
VDAKLYDTPYFTESPLQIASESNFAPSVMRMYFVFASTLAFFSLLYIYRDEGYVQYEEEEVFEVERSEENEKEGNEVPVQTVKKEEVEVERSKENEKGNEVLVQHEEKEKEIKVERSEENEKVSKVPARSSSFTAGVCNKHFLIFTTQRSGSTWFCQLMNFQPHVACGKDAKESYVGLATELLIKYTARQSKEKKR